MTKTAIYRKIRNHWKKKFAKKKSKSAIKSQFVQNITYYKHYLQVLKVHWKTFT